MEIILAKTAGFCPGVEKAVKTAYEEADRALQDGVRLFTTGPIIHNEEVVKSLEDKKVYAISEISELKNIEKSRVIIRSHGVGKAVYDEIKSYGHEIIDATCPFVSNIHKIVYEKSGEGDRIIIIGDDTHPEVIGIKGWCQNTPIVINCAEEIDLLPDFSTSNVTVVAQTTFNLKKFHNMVEILTKKLYNVNVCRTICNATEKRQIEARQLAKDVDCMIVIGGLNSSNTRKLYDISKKECENTYYIQTLVDLDLTALKSVSRVGITAGASTPNYIIQEVFEYVRKF